jgi:hypothetical protein
MKNKNYSDGVLPYLGSIKSLKMINNRKIVISRVLFSVIPVLILIWILTPQQNLQPFYQNIPLDGRVLLTDTLTEGKLYKLIISGEYSSDISKNNSSDKNASKLPEIYINNIRVSPDNISGNKQIFYVIGEGKPFELRIVDKGVGDIIGLTYLDNTGNIYTTIEEANFKVWTDTKPYLQSERFIFYYSLDPIPGKDDRIFFRLINDDKEEVYYIDNKQELQFREGYPSFLTTNQQNEFMWFGCYYDENDNLKFFEPGLYELQIGMKRKGEEFIASPLPGEKIPVFIAITHRMNGEFPEVIQRKEFNNRDAFPYYTHRCLKQVQSFPAGIKGLYSPDEGIGSDFLYFGERGPWLNFGESAPECIGLIQRTLNIIRGTYTEIYEKDKEGDGLIEITSIYDHQMRKLVKWFKEKYKVSSQIEKDLLRKAINLPPMSEAEPTSEELSYIICGDTLKEILNTEFKPESFPDSIKLQDLDNLPAYNPDDERYSLFHLFEEIGRWANKKTKYTKQPDDKDNLREGIIYDISDDAFIALLMAVSYQESGFVQRTGSGRIFRAGRGWGSATGYMQLTADVIRMDSYVIRFFNKDKTRSITLGSLPFHLRYFVRNVNRFNIEIGAQFLKEMWENCGRSTFDKRFREEMKLGGLLDATNIDGLLNRVKLAGASYNAGPEGLRVIIQYPYDDPNTKENESVDMFFDDYDADFEKYVKRFRDDLVLYSQNKLTFPMEKTSKGKQLLNKLLHWLGPYWKGRIDGISWIEAAIMKLDREVIPYVHNTSINVPKLLNKNIREKIFKEEKFAVLVVKKKKEDKEEEKTEIKDDNNDVKQPEHILPEPKQ